QESVSNPVRVRGLTDVTAVSVRGHVYCAVADGLAYCSQTLDGAPTPVADLTGVTDISVNYGRACAVADAAPYCWDLPHPDDDTPDADSGDLVIGVPELLKLPS